MKTTIEIPKACSATTFIFLQILTDVPTYGHFEYGAWREMERQYRLDSLSKVSLRVMYYIVSKIIHITTSSSNRCGRID